MPLCLPNRGDGYGEQHYRRSEVHRLHGLNACPSGAISMIPDRYPPLQAKTDAVVAAQRTLGYSKVRQEQIADAYAASSSSATARQFAEAVAKSNRRMAEDILRESGYLLPQSKYVRELLEAMLEDFDPVGRELTVNQGKGNKERVVYIGDKVIHAVQEYQKSRDKDGQWLFPGRYGEHLHRSVINKLFNRYSEAITPHSLRHFYCTHALESGYSLHEVANQAGHSNIHSTMIYSNPGRTAMKEKAFFCHP